MEYLFSGRECCSGWKAMVSVSEAECVKGGDTLDMREKGMRE